jgi:hypothetical protein
MLVSGAVDSHSIWQIYLDVIVRQWVAVVITGIDETATSVNGTQVCLRRELTSAADQHDRQPSLPRYPDVAAITAYRGTA